MSGAAHSCGNRRLPCQRVSLSFRDSVREQSETLAQATVYSRGDLAAMALSLLRFPHA
jgi:hypothetical protein